MQTLDSARPRILFVDDNPNVLAELHQKLQSLAGEWAMTFARSGSEALDLLRNQPQDIVVSDLRMPGFDDDTARRNAVAAWPTTVRLVLSGQTDEQSLLKNIGAAGSDAGACDPAGLRALVQRTVSLQRLFTNERVRVVVARMDALPTAPDLLRALMAELAREECSLVRAGEIVAQDVAMTAKILRLVNSAYFGFRSQISDPILAVRFLGINTVNALVMACGIFQQADKQIASWLGLERIWRHSLLVSQWARRIARAEGADREQVDDALAAGMLHDVGRLVLATNFPETYRGLVEDEQKGATPREFLASERAVLGVDHAEVGAYLMGTWGLRSTAVEAIAYHHDPQACCHRGFAPLTAVHAACALDSATGGIDEAYLTGTGLADHMEDWRELRDELSEASVALEV